MRDFPQSRRATRLHVPHTKILISAAYEFSLGGSGRRTQVNEKPSWPALCRPTTPTRWFGVGNWPAHAFFSIWNAAPVGVGGRHKAGQDGLKTTDMAFAGLLTRVLCPARRVDLTGLLSNIKVMDALNQTFSALADPTRRAILARLSRGSASVGELAKPFTISGPAISRHLRILETASLISNEREGKHRRCRLRAEALGEVHAWLDHYQKFWNGAFERLDGFITDPHDQRKST